MSLPDTPLPNQGTAPPVTEAVPAAAHDTLTGAFRRVATAIASNETMSEHSKEVALDALNHVRASLEHPAEPDLKKG